LQQEDARKDGIKSHEEDGTQTWWQILIYDTQKMARG
jgi:hypothetical protein